jgi:hypothetical protein
MKRDKNMTIPWQRGGDWKPILRLFFAPTLLLSVFFQVKGVLPPLARSVVLIFASWSAALKNFAKGGPFLASCNKFEQPPGDSRVISWF